MANIEVDVKLDDLAYSLARDARSLFGSTSEEDLVDFVLMLDDQVNSLGFTKALYQALGEVIAEEEG